MKSQALVNVMCELNRTHAIDFVAIMVGFKLELTEATENEAFAYLNVSVHETLIEFFRMIKRRNILRDSDYKRHKDRCLWLLEQISKTTSPMEYSKALCEHIRELQKLLLRL